jgi:hypothetical protein
MELPPRLSLKAHLWQQVGLGAALLLALLFAPGCTHTEGFMVKDAPPKTGHPCQIVTTWLNTVQYAPDTMSNGTPMPGLVGRLYLFGEAVDFPQVGDGAVVVDLFDDTHGPSQQPLERWELDPVSLRKFLKKDTIGWGYSLFLPWSSCRPDVTKVRLTCRYDPPTGSPLYAPPSPLSLEHTASPAAAMVATAPQAPQMPTEPPMQPRAPTLPQLPMPTPVK